jgi:hypothetical protein
MEKASLKDIRLFYKFSPRVEIWRAPLGYSLRNSYTHPLIDQAYYGGPWFNTGFFAKVKIKNIAIHIKIRWWRLKLEI